MQLDVLSDNPMVMAHFAEVSMPRGAVRAFSDPDEYAASIRQGTIELTVTVTDVATRYGFWQFGRFAVEYRSRIGETPSATLQRQPN
jgi:AraC-like DNA-binding protein